MKPSRFEPTFPKHPRVWLAQTPSFKFRIVGSWIRSYDGASALGWKEAL